MSNKKRTLKKKEELLVTIDKLNYIMEPFFRINFNEISEIKYIISKLENDINMFYDEDAKTSNSIIDYSIKDLKKNDLIGILPKLLLSKEIFSLNNDLIFFSNEVLGIDIDIKSKRPRQYLVGTIVDKFLEKKYDKSYDIINKIYNYIDNRAKSILTTEEFFKEWDKIIGNINNE